MGDRRGRSTPGTVSPSARRSGITWPIRTASSWSGASVLPRRRGRGRQVRADRPVHLLPGRHDQERRRGPAAAHRLGPEPDLMVRWGHARRNPQGDVAQAVHPPYQPPGTALEQVHVHRVVVLVVHLDRDRTRALLRPAGRFGCRARGWGARVGASCRDEQEGGRESNTLMSHAYNLILGPRLLRVSAHMFSSGRTSQSPSKAGQCTRCSSMSCRATVSASSRDGTSTSA